MTEEEKTIGGPELVDRGELIPAGDIPLKVRLVFAKVTGHITVPVDREGVKANLVFGCKGFIEIFKRIKEMNNGSEIHAEFFKKKAGQEDMWYLKCSDGGDEYHSEKMTLVGSKTSLAKFGKSDLMGTLSDIQLGIDDYRPELKQKGEIGLLDTLQRFVTESREQLTTKK